MIAKIFFPLFLLIFSTLYVQAQVRVANVFGDNMVLQRDKPIPVWGWARPGEKISIRFHDQVQNTRAAKDSSWSVSFKPEEAGGPYQLVISGKNTIEFDNVLVGEVWVASGQSNMEWPVSLSANPEEEIRNANFPMIRHIKIPSTVSGTLQKDIPVAKWQIATPSTTGNFSAVSFFFARKLYNELRIPIGIINSSWGGTVAETWVSRSTLESEPAFKPLYKQTTFEEIEKKNEQQYQEILKELEPLRGSAGENNNVQDWKLPDYNDAEWKKINIPVNFDQSGLAKFDGSIWFRKTLMLDGNYDQCSGTLKLGTIDDTDETYINGQLIGKTDGYNISREYKLPAKLLKKGKNVIAIRVSDHNSNGGFFSKASDINLVCGGELVSLAGEWNYRIESINKNGTNPNSYPSLLFNAMINPLVPYAIRGVLWYQGESNAWQAYHYRTLFPLLIKDWRKHFRQGDVPFYYVQLASFNAGNGTSNAGSQWAELREAQTATLSVPNTGMAVAFDVGESNDIHPRNKQDVGMRLAAIALNKTYGKKVSFAGPMYRSMKIEGNKAVVEFNNADSGFMAKDRWGYIRGFEIAGNDQKFYYAQAWAQGNRITVFCDSVPEPKAVRYGWADDMPDANLYNREGLPAVPFRTDNWKSITYSP